jgi:hypothetical protein
MWGVSLEFRVSRFKILEVQYMRRTVRCNIQQHNLIVIKRII